MVEMTLPQLAGNLLAFVFTVLVLLYAFGDNPFFRLAIHIFIGAAAGYAAAVALRGVLLPQIGAAVTTGNTASIVVPMLLIALLAFKLLPDVAGVGNPASGLLVGTGAALAVGGALTGTLIPQLSSAFGLLNSGSAGGFGNFINGSIILVGAVTSLAYFQFGAREQSGPFKQRNRILQILARMGHAFIAITLGVVFAGVYSAAISALVERFDFILDFISVLIAG